MKKFNLLKLALSVILIVAISGCTGSAPSLGNGILVEAFEPDFRQVYSTEPVQLQLKIKNTGSVDATGIDTKILNVEEGFFTGDCKTDKLLAPDLDRGTSGGSKLCLFHGNAPKLPKGLTTTYNPVARISYSYNSQLIKSISVVPQAEARRLQNTGKGLPAETISSTSGPVSITVQTKGPIRVFGSEVEFPIEVQFSNVGGGTVCNGECSESGNWNKLVYGIKANNPIGLVDCGSDQDLTLFKGQTNTITCNAKASSIQTLLQSQITVSAEYSYFIDTETSLTVTGIASK